MCWVCDHPEATKAARLAYVRGLLDEHPWVVIGVDRERYRAPYSYTVGLTERELPELLITGLSKGRAAEVLIAVAERVLEAGAPATGARIRLPGRRPGEVIQVSEPGVHLGVAADLFGDRLSAVQLVYADQRGHWPWDKDFRNGRGGQPVLGPRFAAAA
ncbi:MAG TPA: DUF4262 domain-containing protein [Trebonia sp.]